MANQGKITVDEEWGIQTEAEFEAQLMKWANAGHFDDISNMPKIQSGFEWLVYAEENFCRISLGDYFWCGFCFHITPSSKISGVALITN